MSNLMTGIIAFLGSLFVFFLLFYTFNEALILYYAEVTVKHGSLFTFMNFVFSGMIALFSFYAFMKALPKNRGGF